MAARFIVIATRYHHRSYYRRYTVAAVAALALLRLPLRANTTGLPVKQTNGHTRKHYDRAQDAPIVDYDQLFLLFITLARQTTPAEYHFAPQDDSRQGGDKIVPTAK